MIKKSYLGQMQTPQNYHLITLLSKLEHFKCIALIKISLWCIIFAGLLRTHARTHTRGCFDLLLYKIWKNSKSSTYSKSVGLYNRFLSLCLPKRLKNTVKSAIRNLPLWWMDFIWSVLIMKNQKVQIKITLSFTVYCPT